MLHHSTQTKCSISVKMLLILLRTHHQVLFNIIMCPTLFFNFQASDMMKAYPPFVNFFEFAKQTVEKCDKQKPRFHAFLKISHSKPECSRQTLTELLIRPVQRLPSMILLLTGVLAVINNSILYFKQVF